MLGKGNPIQESQIEERIGRAADSFWSAFQMMENGRVKSTLMLYSFCLCWVFAAVYGAAIALLIGPLHMLMAGSPVFLENLVTALVPAVLGTAFDLVAARRQTKAAGGLPVADAADAGLPDRPAGPFEGGAGGADPGSAIFWDVRTGSPDNGGWDVDPPVLPILET